VTASGAIALILHFCFSITEASKVVVLFSCGWKETWPMESSVSALSRVVAQN